MSALYRGLRKRYKTHDNNRSYSKKEVVLHCTLGFQDGDGILARKSVAIIANARYPFVQRHSNSPWSNSRVHATG